MKEIEVKDFLNLLWKLGQGLFFLILLFDVVGGIWILGDHFAWDWGSFWSNFISNASSSAVIAYALYWIITRPDEKKGAEKRRAQALSMLEIEFKTNLQRAKQYSEVLKTPENDLTPHYPLRFTRGAWNALKESGFLPQFEDVGFVYELLRVNEVIIVANSSLSSVRSAKAGKNMKIKLARYSKKAAKECNQIEAYLGPILVKLAKMNLPKIVLSEDVIVDENSDDDADSGDNGESS